jgi:Ca2+-binding RTX toxin-like protein
MANIDIKLSQVAVDTNHLLALKNSTSPDDGLTGLVNVAVKLEYQLGQNYYNFSSYTSSGNTLKLNFPNGATKTLVGTLDNPNNYSGYATVTSESISIPNILSASHSGNWRYYYNTNPYSDYLTFSQISGATTNVSYKILTADVDLGQVGLSLSGAISSDSNGNISGQINKVTISATKFMLSGVIDGSFNVSGNTSSINAGGTANVSGLLTGYSETYLDGSYVKVNNLGSGLPYNGSTSIGLSLLSDPANFSGNDTIKLDLPTYLFEPITISSGLGNDSISIIGGAVVSINLNGGEGNDTITGGDGNDIIDGGAGNDSVTGGTGNDRLDGGLGSDALDGGSGTDTVSYASANAGVTANLQMSLGVDDGGFYDAYTSIENVIGSDHADVIVGLAGFANSLEGGDGNDTFVGEGIDTVIGGNGFDTFFGGQGGALSLDLAALGLEQVWGSYVGDVMNGASSSASLVLVGQGLAGGIYADTMRGGSGNDFVYYRAGDIISGGSGADWAVGVLSPMAVNLNLASTGFEVAWGSTYDDMLNASASTIGVVLVGDAGNDTLLGGSATDFIYGFADNDVIDGGGRGDVLVGGDGADSFIYHSFAQSGFDAIFDFVGGSDRLQLTAVNFGGAAGSTLVSGTSFVSEVNPVAVAALPTFLYRTADGIVAFDADGSGPATPVQIIKLVGSPTLSAGDFWFV